MTGVPASIKYAVSELFFILSTNQVWDIWLSSGTHEWNIPQAQHGWQVFYTDIIYTVN